MVIDTQRQKQNIYITAVCPTLLQVGDSVKL